MNKSRLMLFSAVLLTVALSGTAMASGGDTSVAFFHGAGTAKQTAVFASFLSNIPDAADASNSVVTAISVSNILKAPGSLDTSVFGTTVANDRSGTIEFYLYNKDGTLTTYETTAGSPGSGLAADGTLAAGQTYTVLLSEILTAASVTVDFTGYGWVVANFDGVAGTYNVTIFGLGFTQNFELLPGMGQGGYQGGIHVSVP